MIQLGLGASIRAGDIEFRSEVDLCVLLLVVCVHVLCMSDLFVISLFILLRHE